MPCASEPPPGRTVSEPLFPSISGILYNHPRRRVPLLQSSGGSIVRKAKVYMPRRMPAVFVMGLSVLCLAGSDGIAGQARGGGQGGPAGPPPPRQEPQRSIEI